MRFNPPPNWPPPPNGWTPPPGWNPDPTWGPAPAGWPLWVSDEPHHGVGFSSSAFGRAPAPQYYPATGPHSVSYAQTTPRVDNSFAWTLAFVPLIFILLDVVLLQAGVSPSTGLALLLPVAINTGLAAADSVRLKSLGYRVSTVLAVFILPAYLIERSRKLGGLWAIPIIWFVTFLMYLASSTLVAGLGGVELDEKLVETGIEDWARGLGASRVDVDCPSSLIIPVDGSFECSVTEPAGTYTVQVTVTNEQGYVEWVTVP